MFKEHFRESHAISRGYQEIPGAFQRGTGIFREQQELSGTLKGVSRSSQVVSDGSKAFQRHIQGV